MKTIYKFLNNLQGEEINKRIPSFVKELLSTYYVQETIKQAMVNKTDMVYASLDLTVHTAAVL